MMLGQKLLKLRSMRGITQEELAQTLNMSRSTYAQYEVDRRTPDLETVKKLADFFNVTTDYLLDHQFGNTPQEALIEDPFLGDLLKKVPDLTDEEKESLEEHMQFALKIIEKERKRRASRLKKDDD